jgi:thioredoxin reductase (NADPH)
VVGGGNSAGQAAMHFAPYASKVFIVIRAECLKKTLSEYLIDRVHSTPNIEVLVRTEVNALNGPATLNSVSLKNLETGEIRELQTRWLFLCLGGTPQTQWAADVGIVRDEQGYLVTGPDLLRAGERPKNWEHERDPYYMETNIAGVFAAGDVRHGSVKRCASAVGEGAMAVTFVHRYLANG